MLNSRLFALAIAFCCWVSTQATGQAPTPNGMGEGGRLEAIPIA